MSITKAIDILAVLSLMHLTFYAFTGQALWAPLTPRDDGRFAILIFVHFAPVAAAVFRRLP